MANKLRIIQCLISGHKYEKVDLERYKRKLFIGEFGGFETKEGKIPNLEECVRCGEGRYPIYPWNYVPELGLPIAELSGKDGVVLETPDGTKINHKNFYKLR